MRRIQSKLVSAALVCLLLMVSLLAGVGPFALPKVESAQLTSRSLTLSDANAGATTTYQIAFTIATPGILGSIKIEFCSNTALFEEACTPPTGFDVSGATLAGQTGETGFAKDSATTANVLILSRTPAMSAGGAVSYTLSGVTNTTVSGTSFARFSTFATNDASGTETDKGAIAYALASSFNVNTEVPPFLIFCLGNTISGTDCNTAQGNYVNVGEMGPTYTSSGQTQLVAGTNAQAGYGIAMVGGTMTSGNNEIPVITPGGQSVAGISQFGINLRANTSPQVGENPTGPGAGMPTVGYNQPDHYRYNSGDTIARSTVPDDYRKYTVSYVINVGVNQPPGVYATTFTYVCTGNF